MLTTSDFPPWVTALSVALLTIAVGCALWVAVDVWRRPQHMAVMNVVWPVTMLFGSLLWLWFYLRTSRAPLRGDESAHAHGEPSMRISVAKGTSHCGAGCSLGDLVGEFGLILVPGLATVVGLGTLYTDELYARWVVDFVLAFGFGIVLQYFSIAPMRGLGLRAGLREAIKADAASITAWQVGMYGMMAFAQLWVLPHVWGGRADVLTPEFWWIMQIAMVAGFLTSYPVNWWLVRVGVKEAM